MKQTRSDRLCLTCDFRLPSCTRSDRQFCGPRCRIWWYRNPGVKRLDFSPGDEIPARKNKHGRPKTLADAIRRLDETRLALEAADGEITRLRAENRRLRTNRADKMLGVVAASCPDSRPKDIVGAYLRSGRPLSESGLASDQRRKK
jgi:hypothetical protein